jgi:hypothetical protein
MIPSIIGWSLVVFLSFTAFAYDDLTLGRNKLITPPAPPERTVSSENKETTEQK